jgi:hypothetical protein
MESNCIDECCHIKIKTNNRGTAGIFYVVYFVVVTAS